MPRSLSSSVSVAVTALAASLAAGCPMLANLPGGAPIEPPRIVFAGARLVGAPAQRDLAAYYCPDVISVPLGGAPLLCQGFFGPRPPASVMQVKFEVAFKAQNPNQVPLPVASLLAAATVFPTTANSRVGVVCLQLCPGGPGTCPPDEVACGSSSSDIRSLNDFANAVPRLLLSEGLRLASGERPTLPPAIPAGGELDLVARFAFGPEELLAFLRQLAIQSAGELRSGRAPTFTIPYRLEGTVWFDAGSVGRIAVGWGPTEGIWTLPVERLLGP